MLASYRPEVVFLVWERTCGIEKFLVEPLLASGCQMCFGNSENSLRKSAVIGSPGPLIAGPLDRGRAWCGYCYICAIQHAHDSVGAQLGWGTLCFSSAEINPTMQKAWGGLVLQAVHFSYKLGQ